MPSSSSQQQRAGQGNLGQQGQEMPQSPGRGGGQSSQPHTHAPGLDGQGRAKRDHSHIKGWGADLDHKNRPGYPMERTPPRLEGVHWRNPEQQAVTVEVFHSNERPGITPVFGTSVPPSGLSGWLRAAAFRRSENDIRHWMMLLLADRINVVEGIGQDLLRGRVPNLYKEFGWRAERKHDPAAFARKVAVTGAVLGVGIYLLRRRSSRRRLRAF